MAEPSITVACMAKDEADSYFPSALSAWRTFADQLVLLDDNSSDATPDLARDAFGDDLVEVDRPDEDPAWGNETPHRKALFEAAWSSTDEDDIIFVLDADMCPAQDPTEFFTLDALAWAFPLFDLWSMSRVQVASSGPPKYRNEPPFWVGAQNPRIWAIRRTSTPAELFDWSGRSMHSGHFPRNFLEMEVEEGEGDRPTIFMPTTHGIVHYAYADPADRVAKFKQYKGVADALDEREIAHANTILDPEPRLETLHSGISEELELTKPTTSAAGRDSR